MLLVYCVFVIFLPAVNKMLGRMKLKDGYQVSNIDDTEGSKYDQIIGKYIDFSGFPHWPLFWFLHHFLNVPYNGKVDEFF